MRPLSNSGPEAEQLALAYLSAHGLHLLARNWRCKLGELDLVMLDGDTVVFVEVRHRQHTAWGGALESVDARKRRKLRRTAEHFLQRIGRWSNNPCRFDVVAFSGQQNPAHAEPDWIQNAFDS